MNDPSNPISFRGWLLILVVVHAVVSAWHGMEHFQAPVSLTTSQQVFIVIVILLLPLTGAAMLWSRKVRAGAWLIAISMFAALLFGLLNHFVLNSADNVVRVPMNSHRDAFVLSAVLLAVTETIGTLVGVLALRPSGKSTS